MPRYLRGSKGQEVSRIQARLHELRFYIGAPDGDFGGGTEVAVRRFQRAHGLPADGIVGPQTWRALFPGEEDVPAPALLQQPVELRCVALTGAFETSAPPPGCFACVSGDFDGQGLSFGALQLNFGQRTLQPLLHALDRRHSRLMADIFGDRLEVLRSVLSAALPEQLAFARSIQDPRFRVAEPWRGMLMTLGRTEECQRAQMDAAGTYIDQARALCLRFQVGSARALALMFDIAVQNGGIDPVVAALVDRETARIPGDRDPLEREVETLRIIANRRAEAARPRWIEDVRARKLCIANGQGRVHGAFYHLEEHYGLPLEHVAVV